MEGNLCECYIDLGYGKCYFCCPHISWPMHAHKKKERGNVHENHKSVTVSTFTQFTRNLQAHRSDWIDFRPKQFNRINDAESLCQLSSNQHDIKTTINKLIADGDSMPLNNSISHTLWNLHVYLYNTIHPRCLFNYSGIIRRNLINMGF